MATIQKFSNSAASTLSSAISTTPAAGTSEAWAITSTTSFPAISTGVSTGVFVITPGPTNTTFGPGGTPDPAPELVLATNINDGTHMQVSRGYGGTIRTHQSGDIITLVADAAWLTLLETLRSTATIIAANTYTASTTLALADAGCVVEMNSASATVVTIPTNATVAFPVGTVIELSRFGAGTVTITPASGVTLDSPAGKVTLASQFSSGALRQRAANVWVLTGDLA